MLKFKKKSVAKRLNPICHFPALVGAHHIIHVSMTRVKIIKYFQNVMSHDSKYRNERPEVNLYRAQKRVCRSSRHAALWYELKTRAVKLKKETILTEFITTKFYGELSTSSPLVTCTRTWWSQQTRCRNFCCHSGNRNAGKARNAMQQYRHIATGCLDLQLLEE